MDNGNIQLSKQQRFWLEWFLRFTERNPMPITNEYIHKVLQNKCYNNNERAHLNQMVGDWKREFLNRNSVH